MASLKFDPDKFSVKTITLDGKKLKYRAFENIAYCKRPVSSIQRLSIYVPEEYYEGKTIHGYSLKTAPIFAPNGVGGYMQGTILEPGTDRMSGKPNAVFEALLHGYVVMCAGIRGRNTGINTTEYFVGSNGDATQNSEAKMTGRAPALIVDMKAAIRYLRYNKGVIPGDPEKIITSGTSAGGALSALAGATGNAEDYKSYLEEIGAADERDDIFAANCYCPIHNLENADMAYEWLFEKEHIYHMFHFEMTPEGPKRSIIEGTLDQEQLELSKELKSRFTAYVNSLKLRDENGQILELDANGNGSFQEYVISYVLASATKEKKTHQNAERLAQLCVPGSEIEEQDYIEFCGKVAVSIDFEAYAKKINRMKPVPAFDDLNCKSPENEEFGDEEIFARHFTELAREHSKVNGTLVDEKIVKRLNPIEYIGKCETAKYWRIRHGAFDRDTSIAIPVILATLLKNYGCQVDFELPWGIPHSGDYDLDELFSWIDSIVKE